MFGLLALQWHHRGASCYEEPWPCLDCHGTSCLLYQAGFVSSCVDEIPLQHQFFFFQSISKNITDKNLFKIEQDMTKNCHDTYLIIFELLDSFVFFSFSFRMDSIWPFWDSSLWNHSLIKFLIHSHGLVIFLLIGLLAHALDSLKFFISHDGGVLSCKSFILLFLIGLVVHIHVWCHWVGVHWWSCSWLLRSIRLTAD